MFRVITNVYYRWVLAYHIIQTNFESCTFVAEFYEEALSLVYDLTSKAISPEMWKVLELMYQVNYLVLLYSVFIKLQ